MFTCSKLILICLVNVLAVRACAQLSTVNSSGRTLSISSYDTLTISHGFKTDTVIKRSEIIKSPGSAKRGKLFGSKVRWPLKRIVPTSAFGFRYHSVYQDRRFHYGIDLKAFYEPVFAFSTGIVERVSYDDRSGYYLIINHSRGIKTIYAHLSYIGVYVHQVVKAGAVIAISGNTGVSTGPHLHFALTRKGVPVDPVGVFKYLR